MATSKPDAAIGIVKNALGQYLTVTRPEPPNEFAIPGGHIEAGENASAAMAREMLEETGITVGSSRLVSALTSPTDGTTVHVFVVDAYTGEATAREEGTRIAWLTAEQLRTQAKLFKPSVESLMEAKVLCDLGVGDVHTPSAARTVKHPKERARMNVEMIAAAKRNALPTDKFAWPEQRKFPIDTAARVRNAAARLAQAVKQGRVSKEQASKIHSRIAAAGKKFGVEITADDSGSGSSSGAGGRLHVRADIAHGGSLHVTHHTMTDAACTRAIDALEDGTFRMRDIRDIQQGAEVDPVQAGITLKGPPAWSDGTPKKLVWIQMAQTGAWKGHQAGPFEMTPKTFDEIVANFNARGLPIPCDFEHASESDATDGSIPVTGAPAQGWAHRLENRSFGGLWGLVEWLDYAREGIKAGNFGFLSPAIRFGSKDPVSGAPVGARLTSFAITNSPFLNGIGGLMAARDTSGGGSIVDLADKGHGDKPVHKTHEYMPAVKSALKLDALATPKECADKLDRVRELCMSAGMDGSYMGEDLGSYTQPLRELVDPPLGMTVEEMFDIVEDMIAQAIDEHVEQYHGGVSATDDEDMTMADKTASELTTLLSEKTGEANTLTTKLTTVQGELETTKVKLTDAGSQLVAMTTKFTESEAALVTMTTRATTAEKTLETVQASLTLKDTELTAKDAELVAMKDAETKRADAAVVHEVDMAFTAYKDKRKLTDASKDSMLIVARADIAKFRKDYPPVDAHHMALLRTLVAPEVRAEPNPADVNGGAVPSYDEQVAALQRQGMSYSAATLRLSQRK